MEVFRTQIQKIQKKIQGCSVHFLHFRGESSTPNSENTLWQELKTKNGRPTAAECDGQQTMFSFENWRSTQFFNISS
jgi:hypothetical protein